MESWAERWYRFGNKICKYNKKYIYSAINRGGTATWTAAGLRLKIGYVRD